MALSTVVRAVETALWASLATWEASVAAALTIPFTWLSAIAVTDAGSGGIGSAMSRLAMFAVSNYTGISVILVVRVVCGTVIVIRPAFWKPGFNTTSNEHTMQNIDAAE
jgi:hypothetical protein